MSDPMLSFVLSYAARLADAAQVLGVGALEMPLAGVAAVDQAL